MSAEASATRTARRDRREPQQTWDEEASARDHAAELNEMMEGAPTEAQQDAMGFEAGRRQYMKEQFISGMDEPPELEGPPEPDGPDIHGNRLKNLVDMRA